MAKCKITGKGPLVGHRVSHSNIKTKHRQQPNMQRKRIWDETTNSWVTLRLSTTALRTVQKKGLQAVLKEAGLE